MHEGATAYAGDCAASPPPPKTSWWPATFVLAAIHRARATTSPTSPRATPSPWWSSRRRHGLPVTCETTPHHFALADADMAPYDSNYKMKPPLRSCGDRDAMMKALVAGTITAIATDHAPHPGSEKMQEFERCPFGIIGLETALCARPRRPGAPRQDHPRPHDRALYHRSRIRDAPGSRHPRPGRPRRRHRSSAPTVEWTYDVNQSASRSRNSPFHGRTFHGGPMATIVNGDLKWTRQ